MERQYESKYGIIIKKCPGLHEYWYNGELVARGSSLTSSNPDVEPTQEDWEFCESLRD